MGLRKANNHAAAAYLGSRGASAILVQEMRCKQELGGNENPLGELVASSQEIEALVSHEIVRAAKIEGERLQGAMRFKRSPERAGSKLRAHGRWRQYLERAEIAMPCE